LSSPSAGLSPSAAWPSPAASSSVASAGFSGSLTTVGAAIVAITKSLPWIVGVTFSGNLIKEIFILAPISKPSRSTTNSVGIFSVGHLSSTFLLTMFNTPPLFKPGDASWLINLTGISKIIFAPFTILKKSTWIGLSLTVSKVISLGKTFCSFPSKFKEITFDRKFYFCIKALTSFFESEIFSLGFSPP